MAKHTEGPWTITGKQTEMQIVKIDDPNDTEGLLIAEVADETTGYGQDMAIGEAEANALLISQGPELLLACKRLIAIIRGDYNQKFEPTTEGLAVMAAECAVFVAEGGEIKPVVYKAGTEGGQG